MGVAEGRDDARRPLLQHAVRFGTVGIAGAGVHLAVYLLALHLGAWVAVARALSFACGTSTAYVLNSRWAFGVEGNAPEQPVSRSCTARRSS